MDIIQIILVGSITVLTFWRKDIILYLITAFLILNMGFAWYDSYHTPFGMTVSIMLWVFSAYTFMLGVVNMLKGKE